MRRDFPEHPRDSEIVPQQKGTIVVFDRPSLYSNFSTDRGLLETIPSQKNNPTNSLQVRRAYDQLQTFLGLSIDY